MTHHQVELWGGLATAGLGALILASMIMSMVAGICYRLFMLTSGQAVITPRPRRSHRQAHDGERVPLAELMSQPVLAEDTEDLPVMVVDDG